MRVKHRSTDWTGTVVSSEPEYVMGEPAWRVLWDDSVRPVLISDEALTVIDQD